MSKASKERVEIAAEDLGGWPADRAWVPQPSTCKECGIAIPRTQRRGEAFGGYGRPREFCSARCRKRWSRAHLRP